MRNAVQGESQTGIKIAQRNINNLKYAVDTTLMTEGLPWLESAWNAGDPGLILGSGKFQNSIGEGNGNPFQYSCLKYSMDRGAWQAIVHGVAKSQTQLSD